MRFENGFEVDAPVDRVWDTVLDVERVAPTVPGAKVLEKTGENAYKVGIKVKVGPTCAARWPGRCAPAARWCARRPASGASGPAGSCYCST